MVLPPPELPHGTLIRIGAGLSPDIEALLQGSHAPARVILIEPHPDLSKALALRLAAWPQVTVLAVAVGAAVGAAGGGHAVPVQQSGLLQPVCRASGAV